MIDLRFCPLSREDSAMSYAVPSKEWWDNISRSNQELLHWLTEGMKCLHNLATDQDTKRNHLQLAGLFD
jgi:hypothetical protein